MANAKQSSQQSKSQTPPDTATDKPKKPKRSEGEKRGKFIEIAERRVNNALTAIRRLRPLANRQQYTYDDEQVANMFNVLRNAIDEAEQAFNQSRKVQDKFKL